MQSLTSWCTYEILCWCPWQFLHKNDVRFVFTSSCLKEGSCLIYVICVCLRIVVSNAHYVVVLFFFLFVLCTLCCQFLWIVHFLLPLRYSLTFIDWPFFLLKLWHYFYISIISVKLGMYETHFFAKTQSQNLSFCFVIKSPKQILETYCFYSVFSFLFYFGDLWNSFVYLFFKMYIFSIVLFQQDVPQLNRCRFYCHMH